MRYSMLNGVYHKSKVLRGVIMKRAHLFLCLVVTKPVHLSDNLACAGKLTPYFIYSALLLMRVLVIGNRVPFGMKFYSI